jgi:hypothetical protein
VGYQNKAGLFKPSGLINVTISLQINSSLKKKLVHPLEGGHNPFLHHTEGINREVIFKDPKTSYTYSMPLLLSPPLNEGDSCLR